MYYWLEDYFPPDGRSYRGVLDSNYEGMRSSKWLSLANTKTIFPLENIFPDIYFCSCDGLHIFAACLVDAHNSDLSDIRENTNCF